MPDVASPIGVFDPGVGGLTVLRASVRALPHEDCSYVDDAARGLGGAVGPIEALPLPLPVPPGWSTTTCPPAIPSARAAVAR